MGGRVPGALRRCHIPDRVPDGRAAPRAFPSPDALPPCACFHAERSRPLCPSLRRRGQPGCNSASRGIDSAQLLRAAIGTAELAPGDKVPSEHELGLGDGGMRSLAYASSGPTLPGPRRGRMMAVLSTAWVAPGLAGPALSAEVARLFGWRWVFLGLLPVVAVAGSIAVPALIRLGPPASARAQEHQLIDGVAVAAGATMILAGLTLAAGSGAVLAGLALILAGWGAGVGAPRALVPAGTFTARPGLPATILSRGLLTFAFFGADAYLTLAITAVLHRSLVVAGVAVTGATLSWTAGA